MLRHLLNTRTKTILQKTCFTTSLSLSRFSTASNSAPTTRRKQNSNPKSNHKQKNNKINKANIESLSQQAPDDDLELNNVEYNQLYTPTSLNQWRLLSYMYSPLDSMVGVRIKGSDATKLLQSLTTQNMPEVLEGPLQENGAFYATWLTPKGRLAYDTVIFIEEQPSPPEDVIVQPSKTLSTTATKRSHQLAANAYIGGSYLVMVPKVNVFDFIQHIKDNSLRVKSKIDIDENIQFYAAVSGMKSSLSEVRDFVSDSIKAGTISSKTMVATDPRMLSKRIASLIIAVPTEAPQNNETQDQETSPSENQDGQMILSIPEPYICVDEDVYTAFRVLHGYAQVGTELPSGKLLPLECNMAELNGVKFDKGCYLGQELTARTHYKGLIRKRLVPFYYKPVSANIEPFSAQKLSIVNNTLNKHYAPDAYANSLFPYDFMETTLFRAPVDPTSYEPDFDPENPFYDYIKDNMMFDLAMSVQASFAKPLPDDTLNMLPAPTKEQIATAIATQEKLNNNKQKKNVNETSKKIQSNDDKDSQDILEDIESEEDIDIGFELPEPIQVGKVIFTSPILNIGIAMVRTEEVTNPVGHIIVEPHSNEQSDHDIVESMFEAVSICPDFLIQEFAPPSKKDEKPEV